jgi:hypothetical protein
MNFRCSKHVEREMARRGISRDIVDGVLTAPAPKVPERAGILCVVEIGQNPYLVRRHGERDGLSPHGGDGLPDE